MEKDAKIYVAGHRGMVGSAILRALQKAGYTNFLLRTSKELDLRNQQAVADFFAAEKPDYVFLAAAKVGGIVANNTYRADFLYEKPVDSEQCDSQCLCEQGYEIDVFGFFVYLSKIGSSASERRIFVEWLLRIYQ